MAIKTVTFEDKKNLNTNPSIARINKVIDDDINELKEVANTNANNVGDLEQLNTINKNSLVDGLNSFLTPVFLNEVKGTTSIELPESFNELIVFVKANNNINLCYLFNIPKIILSSDTIGINQGYTAASINISGHCRINVSLTSINLSSVVSNSKNVTDNSDITVYYK